MAYGMYQDPNQGWYADPNDQYGNQDGYEEEQEDTESMQLRKEQEMIEELESNRLYLKKVRRKCVQEDFADLGKTQMFLFEFLVESLEVNAKSELGIVPEEPEEELTELVVRVQFLDTPYLEISDKGEKMEGSDSVMGQTEYFETVGNAGLNDAVDPGRKQGADQGAASSKNGSLRGSVKEGEIASIGSGEPPVTYDTMWENSNGKSLLFSKTALDIIEALDHSSVKVQVSICVEPEEPEEEAREDDWEDEMENEYEGEQENPATSTVHKTEEAEEKKNEKKGMCEPLGYASIRLPDHFGLSVLQSCKPEVILPVSCIHRETCELRNVFGVKKGEIKVFIRLSCFGSVISTSFQSIGPERRYVFKPSPQPDLGGPQEPDVERDSVLKPIIAEEDVAKGIAAQKDIDIFQKSVLWKVRDGLESQHCGCLDMPSKVSQFRESSLRLPRASNNSLCLDVDPQNKGKTCEWHNLVTKEIKNSPGGNCGCMDGATIKRSSKGSFQSLSKELSIKTQSITKISRLDTERPLPSRLAKMIPKKKTPEPNETKAEPNETKPGPKTEIEIKPQINRQTKPETQTKPMIQMSGKVQERVVKPINGFGFRPEPKDCKCNCMAIRNSLEWKPMMKYSWQGK